MSTDTTKKESIHQAVQATYGAVARTRGIAEKAASCCTPEPPAISDYTAEELASVPKGAYLGEGSGTPVRHALLKAGEVVVDLGAGAGMDTFLAANAVGPTGRVHGFDLTVDMLERARRNAAESGYTNVSFERADIEHLPLADGAADAAISAGAKPVRKVNTPQATVITVSARLSPKRSPKAPPGIWKTVYDRLKPNRIQPSSALE